MYMCVSCSVVSDSFVTPWTVAHQALLSMKFSRQWVSCTAGRFFTIWAIRMPRYISHTSFFLSFFLWLCWVLVVALEVFIKVHMLFSCCKGSVVAECRFSCPSAYGISVPQSGIECMSCIARWILNLWTTREVLILAFWRCWLYLFLLNPWRLSMLGHSFSSSI